MSDSIRSKNLDYLRWMHGGQNAIAKKLIRLANYAYISEMANGLRGISDEDARKIEELLALAIGWLDRDHSCLIEMSNLDFELCCYITKLSDRSKESLLQFLVHLKPSES